MDRDHFYVTLFSNASQNVYHSNTIAAFTIQLAKTIELGPSEKWELGLCEISFPPPAVGTVRPTMLVGGSNVLVYCDLLEPLFIGTAMARYLATFIVPSVYNNYLFKNVYYVPVEKSTFRDIRIEVLTLSGRRIAIKHSKTPMKVVLHFKRVATPTHAHS
jgi:hypothetical protein